MGAVGIRQLNALHRSSGIQSIRVGAEVATHEGAGHTVAVDAIDPPNAMLSFTLFLKPHQSLKVWLKLWGEPVV